MGGVEWNDDAGSERKGGEGVGDGENSSLVNSSMAAAFLPNGSETRGVQEAGIRDHALTRCELEPDRLLRYSAEAPGEGLSQEIDKPDDEEIQVHEEKYPEQFVVIHQSDEVQEPGEQDQRDEYQ